MGSRWDEEDSMKTKNRRVELKRVKKRKKKKEKALKGLRKVT